MPETNSDGVVNAVVELVDQIVKIDYQHAQPLRSTQVGQALCRGNEVEMGDDDIIGPRRGGGQVGRR